MEKTYSRRFLSIVLAVMLVFAGALVCLAMQSTMPDQAFAASAAAKAKAKRAYKAKVQTMSKRNELSYFMADFDNDGMDELFVEYRDRHPNGSGSSISIFDYRDGRLRNVCDYGGYGLEKIWIYKKTKSFVCYFCGHGGERYSYLTFKGGKFKEVASKGRQLGPWKKPTSTWTYYGARTATKFTYINKSRFTAITGKLQRGKTKVTTCSSWNRIR